MRNIKHLKPFKKGQSGNPKGRPALPDLKEALQKALDNGELENIINSLVDRAKKGDTRAAQIILDRAFGQAKQYIEQQNFDFPPPIIKVYQTGIPLAYTEEEVETDYLEERERRLKSLEGNSIV